MGAQAGLRVGLIGATGAVGTEILRSLEERRFPVTELVAFASEASEGSVVDFRGEEARVERLERVSTSGCDLVFCAAPGVLGEVLDSLDQAGTGVVDLSGVLESHPGVPLYRPDAKLEGPWVAVPRGLAGPVATAVGALMAEAEPTQLRVVTLESAAGAGRGGVAELAEHTMDVLREMTGEAPESEHFGHSLAFDCLPLVGDLLPDGHSSGERELCTALQRLLGRPKLPVEVTRIRVPTFSGSLASVHVGLSQPVPPDRARAHWEARAELEVCAPHALPTPRTSLGRPTALLGRVRPSEGAAGLAFVVTVDDLCRGSALTAVEVAEQLFCGA